MKFAYKDYSQKVFQNQMWVAPVIFNCEATLLTEADELYKAKFGQDVTKQKHLAVELIKA